MSHMGLYFPLIVLLGCFNAPPQHSPYHTVLGHVSRPEGRVIRFQKGLYLSSHLGLVAGAYMDAFVNSHIAGAEFGLWSSFTSFTFG